MSRSRRLGLVLIVDDDDDIRDALAELLASEGYATCCAANGIEALVRMSTRSPDVVITDLFMPEMDGATFLRKMRGSTRHRRVPVIVLTASGYARALELLGPIGQDVLVLEKPGSTTRLLDAVADRMPRLIAAVGL